MNQDYTKSPRLASVARLQDIRHPMRNPDVPSMRPAGARGRPPGQLRLRVTAGAESILRAGHPWLFADSIRRQNRPGQMGELAVVYDRNNRFLALGLFDPGSTIRVRILFTRKPQPVDRPFWEEQLTRAQQGRKGLFDERTTGFRWINGESDGWPGLVLDQYSTTLVLKLYTAAWVPLLDIVGETIASRLQPETIVLRLSRNIQEFTLQHFARQDGDIFRGPTLEGPVIFSETGLLFEADVLRGQKTGFFLDQRENRRQVENLARGRKVLNAFSFSGGFSVYAARGGAQSVVDLDISPHALASAKRNFKLNQNDSAILACRHEDMQADAFEWLGGAQRRKFDLVVLDPPSLAKREVERAGAILAYHRLASLGIGRLSPKGVLVACSCSAHVSDGEFYDAVLKAAVKSGLRFAEVARSGQPPDHPAAFNEAKYLKAIFLQFH